MPQEMDEIASDVRFPDEVILAMVKEDPNLSSEEAKRYIDGLNNAAKEGLIPFRDYCLSHSRLYGGRTVFILNKFTVLGWKNLMDRI